MALSEPLAVSALFAALLLLSYLIWRRRQHGPRAQGKRREALDTVADWQPEAARVLTICERRAYDLLRSFAARLPGAGAGAAVALRARAHAPFA